MCLKLPLERKAQHAPGLPSSEWKFAFIDPKKNQPATQSFKGLRLLAPNGRRYCSIDRAESHNRSFVGSFDAGLFYRYVGLADAVDTSKSSNRPNQSQAIVKKPRIYSEKKKVDARCYARYINGAYYWGHITKVTGSGKDQTFSVGHRSQGCFA